MINIGVIGYGYWGPNLVRNLIQRTDCRVAKVADRDAARLDQVTALYPTVQCVPDADDVLGDPAIDAVVVATPIATHFELAYSALSENKHVLVEKPMTGSVAEAEKLVDLAQEMNRTLMVDHTFLYTGAVRKLRQIIDEGELGEVLYYDSVRVNLGLFQNDHNVLWDLAPHDFSIMCYLLNKPCSAVSAVGSAPIIRGSWRQESLAHVNVHFGDDSLAHFHVNWLSPVKVRKTLIGGSRKMAVYDDLESDHQVKIYDKGVHVDTNGDRYKALVQYRSGDLLVPKVDQTEALAKLCQEFINSIKSGKPPLTDGNAGLEVVQMLEAAQKSMREENGERVSIKRNGHQRNFDQALWSGNGKNQPAELIGQ